jgi:hypothetical protein
MCYIMPRVYFLVISLIENVFYTQSSDCVFCGGPTRCDKVLDTTDSDKEIVVQLVEIEKCT